MQHLGHPILGDDLYARKDKNFPQVRLMLHAYSIGFKLLTGEEVEFIAPLPQRFLELLDLWEWSPDGIICVQS